MMNFHTAIRALISGLVLLTSVSQAQQYSFELTGSLHTARFIHTATLLKDGSVLVSGGATGSTCPNEPSVGTFEIYDPDSRTWTTKGSFPARAGHTQTLLSHNGWLLAVGGAKSSNGCAGTGQYLNDAYLFNPQQKTWGSKSTLSTARDGHTATRLSNGMVLVAGGRSEHGPLASAELYDPATNTWSTISSMQHPRIGHSAVLLLSNGLNNGKVLVAGGSGSDINSELYNPDTNMWEVTGALNVPRSRVDALNLLVNGKVLFAGGYSGQYVNSAEVYDPATGTWTLTGHMSIPRAGMSTTRLGNGSVIAIGDHRSANQTTEIYDPETETWSLASSLVDEPTRGVHTATMLFNGDILIAGGRANSLSGSPRKTTSSELYTVK
jgi:hypothetical protein